MKHRLLLTAALSFISIMPAGAQSLARLYKPVCDSLHTLLKQRTTVDTDLKIESVVKRGGALDFNFSQELSDYHWTPLDIEWMKQQLKELAPEGYETYSIGRICAKKTLVDELVSPVLTNTGLPSTYKYRYEDKRGEVKPIVSRNGMKQYRKGLSGRHIALWQSHGRYYDEATDRWTWQRAPLFTTVEDMYTQSYVLQFLIPMLENSGAYVMTPRERDIQRNEVIIDNDPAFQGERGGLVRRIGTYEEHGSWSQAGEGFADSQMLYYGNDNPFKMGSARKSECRGTSGGSTSEAIWSFKVPESGSYAVYISYKTLPNSTDQASYTVKHRSGSTGFKVNQQIGGGTWIYLGTFEFDKDEEASVILDNTGDSRKAVTADAVKIGGGMGKIARGTADSQKSEWTTSGMPCYAEGALYWEQFAGIDSTVTRNWEGDYTQDYASRGAWVSMLSGGSYVNPNYEGEGKGIPFDLSLGFHSDAGYTPNDSIVGTLAIYTLLEDGKDKLPDGRSRQLGRHLAGIVQDQVCEDIRSDFEPLWSKRQLWNRNYSESRTTSVPAMLLELLSHQNLADQKYGLDPTFRFTVCRAVYKGILKFLSDEYGIPYVVQPLPVNTFSARLSGENQVTLSWKATRDKKEPTADAEDFILYTRIGDGTFDQGVRIPKLTAKNGVYSMILGIEPGMMYSYRIVAENEGGMSFPSETMCVGIVPEAKDEVLVINNFDRVSSAAWFDTPQVGGFDRNLDSGVGYGYEINYVGDNYEFRRSAEWTDDAHPGFGGSDVSQAGSIIPGNTFDFIKIHGRALMAAGYSFSSASRDAFVRDGADKHPVDLLCGKQVTVRTGRGDVPARFEVFPEPLRRAISDHTSNGGAIIVSGANIGTDVWDEIYPVNADSLYKLDCQNWVKKTLGFKWLTDHGCFNGEIGPISNKTLNLKSLKHPFEFWQKPNGVIYSVENPDGIQPSDKNGTAFLRYSDNGVPAAVAYWADKYKAVSFGFPLESIKDEDILYEVFAKTLEYISK